MDKFTDIGQFRNVIRTIKTNHDFKGLDENKEPIYLHDSKYPVITFRGTVKLHGTNAGISKDVDGNYTFQSRENVLSIIKDNSNFMGTMVGRDYKKLFTDIEFSEKCTIFGEWVGRGIQRNVAVSELEPKHFIIFAVKIDGEYHDISKFSYLSNHDEFIYNVLEFPYWNMEIDFNVPEISINKINDMVLEVEKQCPVGQYFGINGIGEGIVWEAFYNGSRYIFKTKGDKHAGKSKVKTLKTVDVEQLTKVKSVAEQVTPLWRLNQMLVDVYNLNNGGVLDRQKLGDYIRAVINDIIKEDMDIILENGLVIKDITKSISEICRLYYFEQEKNDEFI